MEGLEFSNLKKFEGTFLSPGLEVFKNSKIIEIGAPILKNQLIEYQLLLKKKKADLDMNKDFSQYPSSSCWFLEGLGLSNVKKSQGTFLSPGLEVSKNSKIIEIDAHILKNHLIEYQLLLKKSCRHDLGFSSRLQRKLPQTIQPEENSFKDPLNLGIIQ